MKIKTSVEVDGSLSLSQVANATLDTNQFLVSDGGVVKYRTGSGILSDLGIDPLVKAGVAINKGQAVYVTTADGTNIIVGKASNLTEAASSKTLGLLNASVPLNGMANVITNGLLEGLDTSTATVGDPVWLGENGNLIYGLVNKPYAPKHLVYIGVVTRVNLNNGEIFINVQNGFELNETHDVDLKTVIPVNGHVLGYNGTLWVNKTVAGWLGYTPANDSDVVHISGYETITGAKTFDDYSIYKGSLILSQTTSAQSVPGYMSLSGTTSGINLYDGSNVTRSVNLKVSNVSTLRNIEFPNESGTLALTSDLSLYALDSNVVHLTGNETITGTKTFNGTLNTTTSIFNLAAVDNFPTGGVPDAIRSYVKGHNGTSSSMTTCLYGLIENNKSAGVWIENLSTAPDSTNSIGFRSSFKSTSTGNNFFSGERGATNVFRVNDYGDIYGTKIILGTTVDNTINTLQVNGSARIVNLDPTGIGGITTKLLSYSADPYGLVFRAYATGEHSIQNQRENDDTELFPLLLQPLGGSVGIRTADLNAPSTGGVIPNLAIGNLSGSVLQLRNTTSTTLAGSTLGLIQFTSSYSGFSFAAANIIAKSIITTSGGASGGAHIIFETSTGLTGEAPTEKIRLLGNGNLGIGITNATEKLHISGNAKAISYKANTGYGDVSFTAYYGAALITPTSYNGAVYIGNPGDSVTLQVYGGATANLDSTFNTIKIGKGNSNVATNTVVGYSALIANTTGYDNIAIGYQSLNANTAGDSNTSIGSSAMLFNTTAYNNTAVGTRALKSNTTSHDNTAVGYTALLNSTGSKNTALGSKSLLLNTTGYNNTSVGGFTLYNNTTGIFNTSMGVAALNNNTTGSYNTSFGVEAANTNVSFTNISAFGYSAQITGSNQVQLGNSSTTTYVYGTVQNRSDLRDKSEIRDTVLGLDFISKLRPVDYKWDMRDDYRTEIPVKGELSDEDFKVIMDSWLIDNKLENLQRDGSKKRNRYHHGLIAQEVEDLRIDFGGLQDHKLNGGEDVLSIGYDELIAPMIKAIQELKAEIEILKNK